jgi:hypothetical protein
MTYTRETTIDTGLVERDVVVEFVVHSWGTPDSYYEPGDPAEIVIVSAAFADAPDVDVLGWLSEARDLSIPSPGWPWINHGFKITLGYTSGDPLRPETWRSQPPKVTFNDDRTLLDVIEADVHDHLSDYESDEPWGACDHD